MTKFRKKKLISNTFFASQSTPILNDSTLPSTVIYRIVNRL